jgi:hypothetical protein
LFTAVLLAAALGMLGCAAALLNRLLRGLSTQGGRS